jgi:hypothetical protein
MSKLKSQNAQEAVNLVQEKEQDLMLILQEKLMMNLMI